MADYHNYRKARIVFVCFIQSFSYRFMFLPKAYLCISFHVGIFMLFNQVFRLQN